MKFDPHNVSWAAYECENCRTLIDEADKYRMVAGGLWIPQAPAITRHAGFHISEFYSPWSRWRDIAENFLKARRRREQLQVWVNTTAGETFKETEALELNVHTLAARREKYEDIPEGAVFLTCATDVQATRLESVLIAWGENDENWFIDHNVIHESPERKESWEALEEYHRRPWRHASGLMLHPWQVGGLQAITIDSGYQAEYIYRYVAKHQREWRIYATKGDHGFKHPDIIRIHFNNPKRARFALLGVDGIKATIFNRLTIEEKGSGYCHFSDRCGDEFFQQLTSEHKVYRKDAAGLMVPRWELKEGERNEILDCYAYNFAARSLLRKLDVADHKAKLAGKIAAWKEAQASPDPTTPAAPSTPQDQSKFVIRKISRSRFRPY
jgi:phage terminase large subunit GpA-like protein